MWLSKLLILFVHGLGGDEESWGSFERLLKTDRNLKDRIEIAFYTFRHSINSLVADVDINTCAGFSEGPGNGSKIQVLDRALVLPPSRPAGHSEIWWSQKGS
jgi:hypothetical protein